MALQEVLITGSFTFLGTALTLVATRGGPKREREVAILEADLVAKMRSAGLDATDVEMALDDRVRRWAGRSLANSPELRRGMAVLGLVSALSWLLFYLLQSDSALWFAPLTVTCGILFGLWTVQDRVGDNNYSRRRARYLAAKGESATTTETSTPDSDTLQGL